MVYESDFYTTRRPYSRPNITSYSVTLVPHYGGIVRATPLHVGQHHIPYNAHMRLTPHIVVVPATRTPRSILMAELDRIAYRPRPRLSYVPKEDFLNDHSITDFDDETRRIRAQTNTLLRRVHSPLPRNSRPFPISLSLTYKDTTPEKKPRKKHVTFIQVEKPTEIRPELALPERITSDDYIHRMIEPSRNVSYDINVLSYYPNIEPLPSRIGKGHLACVTYAGGRGYPRRRELYSDNKSIKDEITFRSYYKALDHPGQLAEGSKEQIAT